MTLTELREEARKQGYKLVHRDCIRSAKVEAQLDKLVMHQHRGELPLRDIVEKDLGMKLGHFLIRNPVAPIRETADSHRVYFEQSITVLVERIPDEYLTWLPPRI